MKLQAKLIPLMLGSFAGIFVAVSAATAADWKIDVTQGPCATGACKEVCTYEGSASPSGNVFVRTEFKRQEDRTSIRVKIDFTARYLFWKVRYLIDENDVFDTQTGKLGRIDFNERYLLNGSIKRQLWDRFDADWGQPGASQPTVQGWRIQAKREEDFAKAHPGFMKHWDAAKFGQDWSEDYELGSPVRRPDLDIVPFPENMISPLTLSFFAARFLDVSVPHDFQLFLRDKGEQKTTPNKMAAQVGSSNVTWKTRLILGDLQSPQNRPTELVVGKRTKQLKEIRLALESSLGSAEGTASLQGCRIEAR